MLAATIATAVGTCVLAAFAIAPTIVAARAFSQQKKEVSDQARLLEIQSGQLEAQRQQLADQQVLSKQQTEVLELQAQDLIESLAERKREAEDRQREAARRRIAQAASVYITEEKDPGRAEIPDPAFITGYAIAPSITATVHNTSEQPIYQVELRWHAGGAGYGDPNPEILGVILPGDEARGTRKYERGMDMDVCGAVARFTDAAGVRWLLTPDGELIEQQAAR
jgi:hypothetical protein